MRDVRAAIDAIWRIEAPMLIAGLARLVRDVGLAEDLAQDALVAALERWPESGIPDNPGPGSMATGAEPRRSTCCAAGRCSSASTSELGARARDRATEPDLDAALDDPVDDDLLRLMFICLPSGALDARRAWRSRCGCSAA